MKFGYARVSTYEQNLDLQIDALNKYGLDELYTEKVSGNIKDRTQLNELLLKLRKGDTLIIWKLDRLGRTAKQLIELADDFENKGINFVSIKENFDTSTPTGKFVFHIFCAMAQMERDIISERTKAGLLSARKRGRLGGRKPKNKKDIELALKMYFSKEFSIQEIKNTTGLSKTTLYKYIKIHESNNQKNTENYISLAN